LPNTSFELDRKEKVIKIFDIDWKKKIDFNKRAYLYFLSSSSFAKVDESQYVSAIPVKILEREEYTPGEILRLFKVYVFNLRKF